MVKTDPDERGAALDTGDELIAQILRQHFERYAADENDVAFVLEHRHNAAFEVGGIDEREVVAVGKYGIAERSLLRIAGGERNTDCPKINVKTFCETTDFDLVAVAGYDRHLEPTPRQRLRPWITDSTRKICVAGKIHLRDGTAALHTLLGKRPRPLRRQRFKPADFAPSALENHARRLSTKACRCSGRRERKFLDFSVRFRRHFAGACGNHHADSVRKRPDKSAARSGNRFQTAERNNLCRNVVPCSGFKPDGNHTPFKCRHLRKPTVERLNFRKRHRHGNSDTICSRGGHPTARRTMPPVFIAALAGMNGDNAFSGRIITRDILAEHTERRMYKRRIILKRHRFGDVLESVIHFERRRIVACAIALDDLEKINPSALRIADCRRRERAVFAGFVGHRIRLAYEKIMRLAAVPDLLHERPVGNGTCEFRTDSLGVKTHNPASERIERKTPVAVLQLLERSDLFFDIGARHRRILPYRCNRARFRLAEYPDFVDGGGGIGSERNFKPDDFPKPRYGKYVIGACIVAYRSALRRRNKPRQHDRIGKAAEPVIHRHAQLFDDVPFRILGQMNLHLVDGASLAQFADDIGLRGKLGMPPESG